MSGSKRPVLRLVQAAPKANTNLTHRASDSDGASALRLLADMGFPTRRSTGVQATCSCPFHEGPGEPKRKSPNFYINTETSVYYCHSASCGERGNLKSLERHFGVGMDPSEVGGYISLDDQLVGYERALLKSLRGPFYKQGLTDETIERFRFGFDTEHGKYVIPYLVGRRPVLFRFYQPDGDPKFKWTWQRGAEARLFNEQDAMGDTEGRVLLCESEIKAALAVQLGYAAVGVPGAGLWKPEWQAAFTHARQIVVIYDNDNPAHHRYDKDGKTCQMCVKKGHTECVGHNPGQDAAAKRVEQLGWRARNVLLPLPDESTRKTDLNEYFVRDGGNADDFAHMVTGKRKSHLRVESLQEISENPPEAAVFLVEQGILSAGGRLVVAGPPKAGKSLFVNHLSLSLAAGIPFLGQFQVDHPTRVLLLDRELSKASLYSRMKALSEWRPGYRAAYDNLLIDHDHMLRLDQKGADQLLLDLVQHNGAEVVVLDTAYKFFGGDMEKSGAVKDAFAVLDEIIQKTGCSFVLTHHQRKAGSNEKSHGAADPDRVAGSFLWTGWPNATILLNFLNRSVEDPFTALCTFAAFRDAAPPEPLALHRSRDSIGYTGIVQHIWSDTDTEYSGLAPGGPPTAEAMAALLMQMAPVEQDHFMHTAMARFRSTEATLKPLMAAVMASGAFVRTGRPAMLRTTFEPEVSSWESDHGLRERGGFVDVAMDMGEA